MITVFAIWLAIAIISGILGITRDSFGYGFLLGVLLNVLGIVIVAMTPKKEKQLA